MNLFSSFDVETSKLEFYQGQEFNQSFVYTWQFAWGNSQGGINYVLGRTLDSFVGFLEWVSVSLPEDTKLIVWVHNLSYEFQFLSGVLHFETGDVFNTDKRKVLKATYKNIEFRCSYLLTNMSLGLFTTQMNVSNKKLSGEDFDYSKVRYPWTPLSDLEVDYCINDVVGLIQALEKFFTIEDDDFYSIPLTSTGFVRRDMTKALKKVSHNYMLSLQPDINLFILLRELFRGGNTHSNRWIVDSILTDVKSADRSSSYPDVICNREFPITPFRYLGAQTVKQVSNLIKAGFALAMRVTIKGIRLKDDCWGFPYLPISKCIGIKERDCITDNGRILECDVEFDTSLTDIDLKILYSEYEIDDIIFLSVYKSTYGMLPEPIRNTVIDYYKKKTALKGIKGEENIYNKSKAKVNGCYGMMVQDPTKVLMLYDEGHRDELGQLVEWYFDPEGNREEILKKHNEKGFLPYQWGCWVTAWARYELEIELQDISRQVTPLQVAYCDTDSIKYFGSADFTTYNKRCIENSTKNNAFGVDPKGKTHYMGVFETEKTSKRFITQGAKKYCCEYKCDRVKKGSFKNLRGIRPFKQIKYKQDRPFRACYLKLTCAGVNKHLGGLELAEYDGINSFRNNFKFIKAGGTTSIYNDDINIILKIDRHKLHITKNVCIVDDFYTVGKTGEYEKLLKICKKNIDFVINGGKINLSTEYVQNFSKVRFNLYGD